MNYQYSHRKNFVVGYGSLIDEKSFSDTLSKRKLTPIVVKGYRRIFNLAIMPDRCQALLNAEKKSRSSCNAVMFEVSEKELVRLMKRETEYNVEVAEVEDFSTGKPLGHALIFVDKYVSVHEKSSLPHKPYFLLCRKAAYRISPEFGVMWDKTTFLASGEPVETWIQKHPSYDRLGRVLKNRGKNNGSVFAGRENVLLSPVAHWTRWASCVSIASVLFLAMMVFILP